MRKLNIAVIHTRLNCLDGVSVEINKWIKAYGSLNHHLFQITGKLCKKSKIKTLQIPEIYHFNPKITKIREMACRGRLSKHEKEKLAKMVCHYSDTIKPKIRNFIIKNKIDLLSVENIFSLPVNVSFTIAVADVIDELNLPAIARHHDFYWERPEHSNYVVNFKDIFDEFFPPRLKNMVHVVISKKARDALKKKKGISSVVVHNKFDFSDLNKINKHNLRKEFNIRNDEIIFLQPTKMIRRKKVERSIKLVSRFKKKYNKRCVLVITGVADFSKRYYRELRDLAEKLEVRMLTIHKDLNPERKKVSPSEIYSISDIYLPSDIVTLPSDHEGFGNPVIESVMFKKPLVVNKYSVLNEILNYGFKFIVMNKKVTSKVVGDVYKVIMDKDYTKKIAEYNFKIAYKYFSLDSLKDELRLLIKKAIKNETIQRPQRRN
jgi:glycosyltransferase involved in cell wall biosynthesis